MRNVRCSLMASGPNTTTRRHPWPPASSTCSTTTCLALARFQQRRHPNHPTRQLLWTALKRPEDHSLRADMPQPEALPPFTTSRRRSPLNTTWSERMNLNRWKKPPSADDVAEDSAVEADDEAAARRQRDAPRSEVQAEGHVPGRRRDTRAGGHQSPSFPARCHARQHGQERR